MGSYKKPYSKDSGGQFLLLKGLDDAQKKIQKVVGKFDENSNFVQQAFIFLINLLTVMFRIFEELGVAVKHMNSTNNDWCKRYSGMLALCEC